MDPHEDYSTRTTDQQPWKASPQHDERNAALFGNAQIRASERLSLAAGVRYDYNYNAGEKGGFGSLGTSRVAGIFNLSHAQYVKVIFAQAYQAPPPFQKFSKVSTIRDLAAPDLKPEKLNSIELVYGYSQQRRWRVDVSLYQNLVDNFITLVTVPFPSNPSGTTSQYGNLGGISILGAEMDMRAELGKGWNLYGNASASRAKDSKTGRVVGDIAPWKANLGLDARLGNHVGLSLRTHFVSRRDTVNWDSTSIYSVRQIASYFTMDATLTWFAPVPGLDLHLNLYNLFDTAYYDPGPRSADGKTYNAAILQQPFRGFIGLRYQF